jgi:hypothetical protein
MVFMTRTSIMEMVLLTSVTIEFSLDLPLVYLTPT